MKQLCTLLLSCMLSLIVRAQLPGQINFDSEAISKDFMANLNVYGKAYSGPILDAYSFTQLGGWSQSGKVLRPWAFRIGLQAALGYTGKESHNFNFYDQAFSEHLSLKNSGDPLLPTVMGGNTDNLFVYTVQDENGNSYSQEIEILDGFNLSMDAVPNAVLELGLGLPGNFEASLHILPALNAGSAFHSEYGLGIKNQLDPYFLKSENFNWNVGVFYDISTFSYKPDLFLEGENQKVRMQSQIFMLESTVSYDIKFFTVFGGLGFYNRANNFDILGTYRYNVKTNGIAGVGSVQEAFSTTDPMHIKSAGSGLKASIGATLRIARVVSLTGSYNLAEHNSVTAGLTFNFRTGKD